MKGVVGLDNIPPPHPAPSFSPMHWLQILLSIPGLSKHTFRVKILLTYTYLVKKVKGCLGMADTEVKMGGFLEGDREKNSQCMTVLPRIYV